jgi:hypothetical protein
VLNNKELLKILAMIPEHKITQIYFIVDEYFKEFDNTIKEHSLENVKTSKRNRKFSMSQSEVMTILLLFHLGAAFKNLKAILKKDSLSVFWGK